MFLGASINEFVLSRSNTMVFVISRNGHLQNFGHVKGNILLAHGNLFLVFVHWYNTLYILRNLLYIIHHMGNWHNILKHLFTNVSYDPVIAPSVNLLWLPI